MQLSSCLELIKSINNKVNYLSNLLIQHNISAFISPKQEHLINGFHSTIAYLYSILYLNQPVLIELLVEKERIKDKWDDFKTNIYFIHLYVNLEQVNIKTFEQDRIQTIAQNEFLKILNKKYPQTQNEWDFALSSLLNELYNFLSVFNKTIDNFNLKDELDKGQLLAYFRKCEQSLTFSTNNNPFRVLCLDGGGILGYYTAYLLFCLTEHTEGQFGKKFDLICGTSTGAILACAIANNIDISTILKLYKENAAKIFLYPTPKSGLGFFTWIFTHLFKASSNQTALKEALEAVFKKKTISDVFDEHKVHLCIPSTNYATHSPHIFKSSENNLTSLVDACVASAAAPIYFPIATIKKCIRKATTNMYYTDGGLWANNPIMLGLSEALKLSDPNQPIEIYSIGTITINNSSPKLLKHLNKGIFGWRAGLGIIQTSMSSQASGYLNIAKEIAYSISKLGKKIDIYRLSEKNKSSDSLRVLGLDIIDDVAFETMENLAIDDANHMIQEANTGDKTNKKIMSVFSS